MLSPISARGPTQSSDLWVPDLPTLSSFADSFLSTLLTVPSEPPERTPNQHFVTQEDYENSLLLTSYRSHHPERFAPVAKKRSNDVTCTKCSDSWTPSSSCPFYRDLDSTHPSDLCHTCYDEMMTTRSTAASTPSFYFPHDELPECFMDRVRKFDLSVTQILQLCFSTYGPRPFVGTRSHPSDTSFSYLSFTQVYELSLSISRALRSNNYINQQTKKFNFVGALPKGSFVGILSSMRPEVPAIWFGCLFAGAAFVPVQRIMSVDEKVHVLGQTGVRVVFTERRELEGLLEVRRRIVEDGGDGDGNEPFWIVIIDEKEEEGGGEEQEERIVSWGSMMKIAASVVAQFEDKEEDLEPVQLEKDDLVMIMHTSGTTGVPKGIQMDENLFRNWITREVFIEEYPLIGLCFIPLSHISGMCEFLRAVFAGGRIGILCQGDLTNVFTDFRILRPTFLTTMPRLLVFAFNEFHRRLRHEAEDVVRSEMANLFGDRIWSIFVGSAYCSPEVKHVVRHLVKRPVIDVYGVTEVGWVSGNYYLAAWNQMRLEDCPELGYRASDEPYPRGQLLIRNAKTDAFPGYYNMPKVTASKYDDGRFFRTGDVVEIRENGRLFIIDRTHNICKLGQGEFVSFEKVEAALETSTLIDQVVAFATPKKTKLVALVKVFDEAVTVTDVLEDMQATGKVQRLNSWEIPARVHLTLERFPLTEMKKKSRRRISAAFEEELERLYALVEGKKGEEEEGEEEIDRGFVGFLESLLECGKGGLKLDVTWEGIGGNSFRGVSLLSELRSLGVSSLEYSALQKMTIREIVGCVEEKESEQEQEGEEEEQKKKQEKTIVILEPEIVRMTRLLEQISEEEEEDSKKPTSPSSSCSVIFLTGATGFLGSHLVADLLSTFPDAKLVCLVRSPSDSLASNSRIEQVVGDLAKENFGLSESAFRELSNRVDLIIHAGAMVNHFVSYADHYDANVRSAFDIVKLSKGWKPIVYVSSMGVWHGDRSDDDDERVDTIFSVRHLASSGYSASKWVADCLFARCCAGHAAVIRPSLIGPCSSSGVCNLRDWLSRSVHGMLSRRCFPTGFRNGDVPLDLVSVDVVSHCICSLAQRVFVSIRSDPIPIPAVDISFPNITIKDFVDFLRLFDSEENGSDDEDDEKGSVLLAFGEWLSEMKKDTSLPIYPFAAAMDPASGLLFRIEEDFESLETPMFRELAGDRLHRYEFEELKKWFLYARERM